MIVCLYRIYSKKSLNKNQGFKYTCVISVVLAVSIMFYMQIMLSVYEKDVSKKVSMMNGADVKILDSEYLKHNFNDMQLTTLQNINKENSTLGFCNETNIIANEKVDTVALTVLDKNISTLLDNPLNSGEVAISKSVATRMGIHKGDSIYVKLHSDVYEDTSFKVTQIIDDRTNFSVAGSEYEVAQETLGSVYMILPNFFQHNVAYINDFSSVDLKKLEKYFIPSFNVRTLDELNNIVLPRVKVQVDILKMISGCAMLFSGICLVWSFLIFIMDRKDDFLIFGKLGIRTQDLMGLIFLEIFNVLFKGICLGIPIGGVSASIYLYCNEMFSSLSLKLISNSIFMTVLLTILEVAVFSLIPMSKIKKIVENNKEELNRIPLGIIITIVFFMVLISCAYVRSSIGILFSVIVVAIFGAFYYVLILLSKLVLFFLSFHKNKNILFIKEFKANLKITAFSSTLINVSLVICLILINVVPYIYTSTEKGTSSVKSNISYRTMQETEQEEILMKNEIEYFKCSNQSIQILKVNNESLDNIINKNIAEDYKSESAADIGMRNIDIYDNDHMPREWKKLNGIYVNNIYRNIIDFKKGDILTISLNDCIIQCEIADVFSEQNNKDLFGILSEDYFEKEDEHIQISSASIVYTLLDNINDSKLAQILISDRNANIEKNEQLSRYLSKYIDNQKLILINNVVAVGFSSILLVLLGQMILFARKKEYYNSLWKIGMGRDYLIKSMMLEKSIYSLLQILIISLFFEPVRYVIISETLNSTKYEISLPIVIIELLIILTANLFGIYLTLYFEKIKCLINNKYSIR